MKRSAMCGGLVLLLALQGSASEAAGVALADLKWLAGCWAADGAEPGSLEVWMPPAGGSMLGMSRTIRRGKMSAWEFIRIAQQDDGTIEYIAKPHNQEGATFRLISSDAKALTFENATHDFPQRVIYRLAGDGTLQARIEGTINGAAKGIDYPMKKAACE
jgi:hypothetical protein